MTTFEGEKRNPRKITDLKSFLKYRGESEELFNPRAPKRKKK